MSGQVGAPQTLSIAAQLAAGIRALDVTLTADGRIGDLIGDGFRQSPYGGLVITGKEPKLTARASFADVVQVRD